MTEIIIKNTRKFRPLACQHHAHSDVGSLDGGATVDHIVDRAIELGRPAVTLTDHGTMNSLASLHQCCKKKKLLAIHGIEIYLINPFEPEKLDFRGNPEPNYVHLTIHFVTRKAYEHFCKLTPIAEQRALVRYGERKPLVKIEELEAISDDITISSGCLVGLVQKYVLNGKPDMAKKAYERIRAIVPQGRFFVEIFPHVITHNWKPTVWKKEGSKIIGIEKEGYFEPNECLPDGSIKDIQKLPNEFVIDLAKKYGDPVVISEDAHLANEDDKSIQDVRLGNGLERWRFFNSYHMGDSDEWALHLKKQMPQTSDRDIEEWIDNSYKFVDLFKDYKFYTSDDRWLAPEIHTIYGDKYEGKSSREITISLIKKVGRFPSKDHPQFEEYKERLRMELEVLEKNGKLDLLPYFLCVADIADWAREQGMMANARGSAGGSLLAYLLGITITDPIKWNLQFERFLTLGRIKSNTLPDIDADFPQRDPIINYIKEKYGDKFALISINTLLKPKSAMRDIERAFTGRVDPETEAMLTAMDNIPQGVDSLKWLAGYEDETTGEHVPGFIDEDSPAAAQMRRYKEQHPDIWKAVEKSMGLMRQKSIHACGIVISNEPISKNVPLTMVKDDLATGYCPKGVEYSGLIKFDILGVSTLHAIQITLESINKHLGVKMEWDEFPHDPEVYEHIIGSHKLAGIFQISTKTMRPFVKKIQPKTVNDISNICALVRPGALDAPVKLRSGEVVTAAEFYMDVAQGKRGVEYIHPDLEPITGWTNGIILFQEQALEIFRKLADYSFEVAEGVRRAIGKKIKSELDLHLGVLKTKCTEKGWTESQAQELCDVLVASARYSFNKSHSCLAEDQKIITDKGPKTVKEIIDGFGQYHLQSLDLVSGNVFYEKPDAWFDQGEKEVFEYILDDGSTMRLTSDHKVLFNGEWVNIGDIEEGVCFEIYEEESSL